MNAKNLKHWSEYLSWKAMIQRERRGLCEVDERFRDFEQFLKFVGLKETPEQTLDRIDNGDREYGPLKVRWASKRMQTRNRRNTIWLTYLGTTLEGAYGTTLTLNDWAELTDQKPATMRRRRSEGWSDTENIEGKRFERATPFSEMSERRLLDYQPWPIQIAHECEAMYSEKFDAFEDRFDFYLRELIPMKLEGMVQEGRELAFYMPLLEDRDRAFDLYVDSTSDEEEVPFVRAGVWCPLPETDAKRFELFLQEFERVSEACEERRQDLQIMRSEWADALSKAIDKAEVRDRSAIRDSLKAKFYRVQRTTNDRLD